MRINPGPFEPIVYMLQTPAMFRVLGLGGLVLFTVMAIAIAGEHSAASALIGIALLGAVWLDASLNICRRCRFYGTWHCMGQGMLVSKLFSRIGRGVGESGVMLHAAVDAAFLLWGLFWLWHLPMLGFLFTLWAPLAFITATSPSGFSWRARKPA